MKRRDLARAAVRSALRRYPPEIVNSLLSPRTSDPKPLRDLLEELAPEGLAVCWLGHGSVVIEAGGLSFCVDPVLSERIGPRVGKKTVGLRRLCPLPIDPRSLRGVDAIMISHAHFDHLDRPTLQTLADTRTTVFVPPRCRRLIPPGFKEVIEVAPEETISFNSATIETIAPRHWGARTFFDRRRGSLAYIVRQDEFGVLFTGDTAETEAFNDVDDIDLAVFGIGAYDPWEHMHATPEQVWRMFTRTGARYLLPVHHSTFELSDEPLNEPMNRLVKACEGEDGRIIQEKQGEVVIIQRDQKAHASSTPASRTSKDSE